MRANAAGDHARTSYITQLQTRVFADETDFDDIDRLCPAQPHNSPRRAAGGRGDGGNRVVEREHEFTLSEPADQQAVIFLRVAFSDSVARRRRCRRPRLRRELRRPAAPLVLMVLGSSFFSAMPHRLDEMMYKHNPLGTV